MTAQTIEPAEQVSVSRNKYRGLGDQPAPGFNIYFSGSGVMVTDLTESDAAVWAAILRLAPDRPSQMAVLESLRAIMARN